jgi:hypothetical protein
VKETQAVLNIMFGEAAADVSPIVSIMGLKAQTAFGSAITKPLPTGTATPVHTQPSTLRQHLA